jgi:chemotaxis protein CheD
MTRNQTVGPLVKVGMAQFRVGAAPLRIITMALGSCLGLVLYDPEACIGALAHAMHPRRDRVRSNEDTAKFVDSVIGAMLERMLKLGARRELITAKIFGGARMFDHVAGSPGVLQIGEKNVVTAREELKRLGIPILAECVGGTKGRTILFDVSDGSVRVRDALDNEEMY